MEKSETSQTNALTLERHYDPDQRVVAVTGVCGFLGQKLIERLEQDHRYHKILAIDISSPSNQWKKTEFFKVDLTHPAADATVATILKDKKADTFVHLAFLSNPTHNRAWAHELEAIGTLHVLNACAACNVHKVVMWSLTALYGPHSQNANFLDEDHATQGIPNSRFFEDKIEAERLIKRFSKENPHSIVTILRTAPLLSLHVNTYVTKYFSSIVVPVLIGHDPLIQLLHEEDTIDAFKLSIDADFGGIFNIAGKGVLPLSTIIAMTGRIALPLPKFLTSRLLKFMWMTQLSTVPPGFIDFLRFVCVANTDRATKTMGFFPRYDIRQIISNFSQLDISDSEQESI